VLVNPTRDLEESGATRDRLADLRGGAGGGTVAEAAARAKGGKRLPVLGTAPELRGTQSWFNTANGRPLTLRSLRGRVVLIDFWTYSCINCLRTLPALRAWDARYRRDGLTIVGVHSPEFPFERDAANVERAIGRNRLRYPVVQDNEFATWNAYGNQYWPAKYLIDARGRVRYAHFGEGEYAATENVIRRLLAEGGRTVAAAPTVDGTDEAAYGRITPETYVGYSRLDRYAGSPLVEDRPAAYRFPAAMLPLDHLALAGGWRVEGERAVARGDARLRLRFRAREVNLVLGGMGRVDVLLDGMRRRSVAVDEDRLYRLLELPADRDGTLELRLTPGVEAYAFTFG
jgi:thiol-disulfide isomerase/thioredoxin